MSPLAHFGLFAASAMLVWYALESRSMWFTLAFVFPCVMGSPYGFLQDRIIVAPRRWWLAR